MGETGIMDNSEIITGLLKDIKTELTRLNGALSPSQTGDGESPMPNTPSVAKTALAKPEPSDTDGAENAACLPELLTTEQAHGFCGMSKSAWYKAQSSGKIPPPVRIGTVVRWRREELRDWIRESCPPVSRWKWSSGNGSAARKAHGNPVKSGFHR